MTTRTIPFTPSQQSSIRTTGVLMLPVGLLLLVTGVQAMLTIWPTLMLLPAMPLALAVLYVGAHLALGSGLILGGFAFLRAAREGTVQALVRGLRALCVVFVIKAVLLLAVTATLLFGLLGISLLSR